MTSALRTWLRRRLWWIKFQELNREGWSAAWSRRSINRVILSTPPVPTARCGSTELRVLTWRRDWINMIWGLKTFYHFSGQRFPLYIHDGGLLESNVTALLAHFPNAVFVSRAASDLQVESVLSKRGLQRCLAYRRKNTTTLKLFDFFLLSRADTIISIDSDILFFRRPSELLEGTSPPNLYNRDETYFYSLSLDEIQRRFGVRPFPFVNSGLSRVARKSIEFGAIERWLQDGDLFADDWVTEQTLHALAGSCCGACLLPDTYLVSTKAGLPQNIVCKHYPGNDRRLLYEEGMRHLIESGFCTTLDSFGEPG